MPTNCAIAWSVPVVGRGRRTRLTTGDDALDVGRRRRRPARARRPGRAGRAPCSASTRRRRRAAAAAAAGDGQRVGAEPLDRVLDLPWPSRCRPRPAGSPRPRRSGCRAWSAPERSLLAVSPRSANRSDLERGSCRHRPVATCRRVGDDLRRRPAGSAAWRARPTSSSWVISTMVRPGRVEPVEDAQHVAGGLGVQVAGRLVGEQQRRRGDQRPGHRDPLLLAAGELVGLVVGPVGQARPGPARPARPAPALGAP